MNITQDRILVTGASGGLGRAVVDELLERGAKQVVAASRTPEKLADLAAKGVELRAADFDRPETLRSAFEGVSRLALISTDALEEPGRRLAQHRAAIDAAVSSGVEHVVYTSAPGTRPTSESPLIDDHFWTEAALFASPLSWTILRNQLYMELVLRSVAHAAESGRLFSATAGRGRAYVARDDCARAVAGALIRASGSEILDVTGPAALSPEELAAVLSKATGKSISPVKISPQELADGLAHAGVPPMMAKIAADFDVDASQGYHALVTPAVERLTGRPPTTLEAFLDAHLARE